MNLKLNIIYYYNFTWIMHDACGIFNSKHERFDVMNLLIHACLMCYIFIFTPYACT